VDWAGRRWMEELTTVGRSTALPAFTIARSSFHSSSFLSGMSRVVSRVSERAQLTICSRDRQGPANGLFIRRGSADGQAESITEGTLKQWSKQVGDFVKQDEEIATIETDKVGYSFHPIEALT
jgi:2-oxoglutarate dehydrogenase E2 component (dihydrolipoamide succinyltransferase)